MERLSEDHRTPKRRDKTSGKRRRRRKREQKKYGDGADTPRGPLRDGAIDRTQLDIALLILDQLWT